MSHTLPWGPSPLSGWRGVASASGGFPEPAAPSYGAPGVEFMGLHQENNAVVQIYFLPGQVRPSTPFLLSHLPEGEASIWWPWMWCCWEDRGPPPSP